jgi:hypothetical protein
LAVFDTETGGWVDVKVKGDFPIRRLSHVMAFHNGFVFMWGGFSKRYGNLDDLWLLRPVLPLDKEEGEDEEEGKEEGEEEDVSGGGEDKKRKIRRRDESDEEDEDEGSEMTWNGYRIVYGNSDRCLLS